MDLTRLTLDELVQYRWFEFRDRGLQHRVVVYFPQTGQVSDHGRPLGCRCTYDQDCWE